VLTAPLQSVVNDENARAALCELARAYHRELELDRGMDTEAQILEVIRDMLAVSPTGQMSVQQIATEFSTRHADSYEQKITARWPHCSPQSATEDAQESRRIRPCGY
jgi:hypothetical protein